MTLQQQAWSSALWMNTAETGWLPAHLRSGHRHLLTYSTPEYTRIHTRNTEAGLPVQAERPLILPLALLSRHNVVQIAWLGLASETHAMSSLEEDVSMTSFADAGSEAAPGQDQDQVATMTTSSYASPSKAASPHHPFGVANHGKAAPMNKRQQAAHRARMLAVCAAMTHTHT